MESKEDIVVKIPDNYTGNPVRVIVDKERIKVEKDVNFISFHLNFVERYLMIGDKQIEMDFFYKMLRLEGGLSDRIPLVVNIMPFYIRRFDETPLCYNGKRVWFFNWKGRECSITGNICIRVHNASLKESVETFIDIRNEALKLWKDPKQEGTLDLYIPLPRRGDGIYVWHEHSTRPKRNLETIYIDEKIKQGLVNDIEKFLGASALYDKYGVTWKKVILFAGKPGTGKTSTVLSLASHFDRSVAKMTVAADMTSTHVELLFKSLPKQSFVMMEDIDALFVERTAETKVDFSTILNLMDGVTTTRGLVLFLSTNHIEKINDSAFKRAGRIDQKVFFESAGPNEWRNALQILGEKWPHEHDAYIEQLQQKPDESSIADIQKHLFECLIDNRDSIL